MSDQTDPRQLVGFTLAGEQHLAITQVREIVGYTEPRPVAPSGDSALIEAIAKLGDRLVLVAPLAASTIFAAINTAAG